MARSGAERVRLDLHNNHYLCFSLLHNADYAMSKQKFQRGDLVQIAEDLGRGMRHFTSNKRAVVVGTCDEQYGSGNIDSYTLHIEGEGEVSWYHEHQLTLIKKGGYPSFKKHIKRMFAE